MITWDEITTLENIFKLAIVLVVAGWLSLFFWPFFSTFKAGNWSNEAFNQALIDGFNWEFKLASLAVIGIVLFLIWLKNVFSSSRD